MSAAAHLFTVLFTASAVLSHFQPTFWPIVAHKMSNKVMTCTSEQRILFSCSIYHSYMPDPSRGALGVENDDLQREVDFTSNLPQIQVILCSLCRSSFSTPRAPRDGSGMWE